MNTRRQFLVGSGLLAAGSIAGCSSLTDADDSHSQGDLSREYTDWIAASMAIEAETELRAVSATAEIPFEETSPVPMEHQPIDPASGTIEHQIELEQQSVTRLTVTFGDFSAESAKETAAEELESELKSDGEYGGFDRYTVDDRELILGFRDGVMVVAVSADLFESAIDASRGETDRLVDTDEDFALVAETLDDKDGVIIFPDGPGVGEQLFGGGFTPDGEETAVTSVAVFDSEQAAEDAQPEMREEVSDEEVEVRVDGRTVTAIGTIPTEEIVDGEPDTPTPNIHISDSQTVVDGRIQVELLVESADANVDAETIFLRGEAVDGSVQWSEGAEAFAGEQAEASAGETLTLTESEELVSDPAGMEIDLIFETEETVSVLATFEVRDP